MNGFDPTQNYDPSMNRNFSNADGNNANGLILLEGGNAAQVDVKISNAHVAALKLNLFGMVNSIAEIAQAQLTAYTPFTPESIVANETAGVFALDGLIYFDASGDLIIQNADASKKCVVHTPQAITYKGLFNASNRYAFRISKIRLTVTNDAQLNNELVFTEQTFLGAVKSNSVNPRAYLNPNQFQSKVVDIPVGTIIDFEKGMQYQVEAGEVVNLSLFIDAYRKMSLGI